MIGKSHHNWLINYFNKHDFLPFDVFMSQMLYAPEIGYYMRPDSPFGCQGDFITGPMMTPCFGDMVVHTLLNQANFDNWLEWGPGAGHLAVQVIKCLHAMGRLPKQYYCIELNPYLREKQKAYFEDSLGPLAKVITWVKDVPNGFKGFVLAHEILDALPAKRVGYHQGKYVEHGFSWQDGLTDVIYDVDDVTSKILSQLKIPKIDGYTTEWRPTQIEDWLSCHDVADDIVMMLFDYGYERLDYYHPDRRKGTLRVYSQHQECSSVKDHLGQKDISVSVDWSSVGDALIKGGWQPLSLQNQAQWFGQYGDRVGRQIDVSGLNTLIHTSMGEVMKVALAFKKMV